MPLTNFGVWGEATFHGSGGASPYRGASPLPPYHGPVNEVDDVAHILFVGQTGEAFLGERRNWAQVIGKLPEQFEPGIRLETVAADNGFER